METLITFMSQEKLGEALFMKVEEGLAQSTKKARASTFRWLINAFYNLGLIEASMHWTAHSISIGSDNCGNYGVFVVQAKVQVQA